MPAQEAQILPSTKNTLKTPRQSVNQRRETLSLLGEIVYEAGSPIARIHGLASVGDDESSGHSLKSCLVSGRMNHIESDLADLYRVLQCVADAYPKDFILTTGLDITARRDDFMKESEAGIGSRLLSQRCLFVGAVIDIGREGYCVRYVDAFTKGAFWDVIRSVGCVGPLSHNGGLHMESSHLSTVPVSTVGRIVIAETILPEVLVALHIALAFYFDITAAIDLYAGLATLGQESRHEIIIRRGTRRARFYTIDFLYSLTHEERLKLPQWHKQRTSVLYDDKYPPDFYVGHGTSVLQLSEEHERGNRIPLRAPFRPWKILVIPAVPRIRNWRHQHPLRKARIANGTEAWIWTIWSEHQIAYTAIADLHRRISDRVSPPKDFMFNLSHIDALIFDDENYTKSKLYFWAYQSLEMVQSELVKIIRRWKSYRTSISFSPPRNSQYIDQDAIGGFKERIGKLLGDMDACLCQCQDLIDDCKMKQREIAALRDGLFNGSAVLESRNSLRTADQSLEQTRTAIAQGENIKALTIVSIFFLPLAFVSSVFGMTHLPESGNMNAFAICMVSICIPAYILIGSIMNTQGLKLWRAVIQWLMSVMSQSWTVPKYRTFRGLAEGTFRIATWNIEPEKDKEVHRRTKESIRGYMEDQIIDSTSGNNANATQQIRTQNKSTIEVDTEWKLTGWNRRPKKKGDRDQDIERGNTS